MKKADSRTFLKDVSLNSLSSLMCNICIIYLSVNSWSVWEMHVKLSDYVLSHRTGGKNQLQIQKAVKHNCLLAWPCGFCERL